MGRGISRTWRNITAALALCGVLTYATLIPGHIVSQVISDLVQSEFGDALALNCHSGGSADRSQLPGPAQKKCPFCTGAAAFQVADLAAPAMVTPPAHTAVVLSGASDAGNAALRPRAPNSRGPPYLPV
jgi:hypothetical protein